MATIYKVRCVNNGDMLLWQLIILFSETMKHIPMIPDKEQGR